MRKQPTDAERALWRLLRNKRLAGWKFKRQQSLGRYIVDFVCFEARLIVEADGSQHLESAYDAQRDSWLLDQNFRLLRFWNRDILLEAEGVLTAVLAALEGVEAGIEPASPPTPLPAPPPQGGREKKDISLG
jgi:very-short-patch-repair endonuclease